MDRTDDECLSELLADLERLRARPTAEIGVPMFLVPEDLRGSGGSMAEADAPAAPLGAAFVRAAEALERHRGELTVRDVAGIVEVLADRAFGPSAARPA